MSDNSKLNFPLLDWLDEEDRGEKGFTGYNLKFDEAFRVKDALNAPATSSDGRLIEALECAKYAIENPDSNQAFAIMAIDHALNTATSSDELVKEIDEYFDSRSEHAGFDP